MDTIFVKHIKQEIINEIIGEVSSRGYLDNQFNCHFYFMYIYRGKSSPHVNCIISCEQEFSLIDMEGTYSECHVTALNISPSGKLFVHCEDALECADNVSIDDLCDIRDFVKSLTDDDLRECKDYCESIDDQEEEE